MLRKKGSGRFTKCTLPALLHFASATVIVVCDRAANKKTKPEACTFFCARRNRLMMIFVVTAYLHVHLHLYHKVLFCKLLPGLSAEASVWNLRVTLVAKLRPFSTPCCFYFLCLALSPNHRPFFPPPLLQKNRAKSLPACLPLSYQSVNGAVTF